MSSAPPTSTRPDRQRRATSSTTRASPGPERTGDDDADRAPEARVDRQQEAQAVDAQRADRVADEVAEERVLVVGRLRRLPLLGVGRRQDQRAVQRQRERGGEEQRHRQHVRRVVVEVQVGVAGVADPVEMAEDPVGEGVPPGAHQHGAEDVQRDEGQDRDAEGEGHVVAHGQLAADLDLAQRPGHEGADGADRDDLPQPALLAAAPAPGRRPGSGAGCGSARG